MNIIPPEISNAMNKKSISYKIFRNLGKTTGMLFLIAGAGCILSFPAKAQDEYWHQRVSLFDKLPVGNDDIVFLGNSITDGGEFSELFGMENVLNRGIRSDRIDGVRKRLDQVTSGHPSKIFLLIGINDVANSRNTAESIAGKYELLVKEIREKSPQTTLYIQSVMPINNDFKRYKSLTGREDIVKQVNSKLIDIAAANGAVFLDLWPALADPTTGKLRREFTNDGLHLTGAGYRAWVGAVKEYVVNKANDSSEAQIEESDSSETTGENLKHEESVPSKISIVKKME